MFDTLWLPSNRNDPRVLALYKRHYSAKKNAAYRKQGQTGFVAAGSPIVLITAGCDAAFVWLKNTVARFDQQIGIICTMFRNESSILSSDLIREADDIAWHKWADNRHFTYVDASEVSSPNPGYCFKMAGWKQCGVSKSGLIILEIFR